MKLVNEGSQADAAYGEAVRLAARLTPVEGYNQTSIVDLTVLRRSKSIARSPVIYSPSIIFVLQGKKVDYLGDLRIAYKPKTVLVLSAPMPFQCVVQANQNTPLLSVVVRLRREVVLHIVSRMRDGELRRTSDPQAIRTATLGEELLSALVRLLKSALSPEDAQVLGEQTVRELIYHVLKSEGGDGVRAMVDVGGALAQILKALQSIHSDYARSLLVADLARRSGMSVSAFHARFKQVTSTSPIQYIKAVRLHRARALLFRSGVTAGSAATSVGYSSASQFGRDYKELFGESPARDVAKRRGDNPGADEPFSTSSRLSRD